MGLELFDLVLLLLGGAGLAVVIGSFAPVNGPYLGAAAVLMGVSFLTILLLKHQTRRALEITVEETEREVVSNNLAKITLQVYKLVKAGYVARVAEGSQEEPQTVLLGTETNDPIRKGKPVFHAVYEVTTESSFYVAREDERLQ